MPAERRRAAALYGADDLVLRPGDAGAAALDEAAGEGAEDVGYLQDRPAHDATGSHPGWPASASVSSGLGAAFNFRVDR